MADDLELSYAAADAFRAVGLSSAAAGAQPTTYATRTGGVLTPGAIVFDPITGQHGVVIHVSQHAVISRPPQP